MTSIWLLQIKSDNANWLQRYLHEEGPEKSFKSKWNWTDLIFEKALHSSCVWQCELIVPCVRQNWLLYSNRLSLVGVKSNNLGAWEIHIRLLKLEVYKKVCIVRNFYGEDRNDILHM